MSLLTTAAQRKPDPSRHILHSCLAASPSWTPGDEELEQAALAVSLLARLPGALRSHDALLAAGAAPSAITGALSGLRDDMWQLWQALAGHDKGDAAASGILVSVYRGALRTCVECIGVLAGIRHACQAMVSYPLCGLCAARAALLWPEDVLTKL